jgi:hypothetical protein
MALLTISQSIAIKLEFLAEKGQFRKSDVTSGTIHAGLTGKRRDGKGWK